VFGNLRTVSLDAVRPYSYCGGVHAGTYIRFSISVPPEVAAKLRAIADEHHRGKVSRAVADAVTKWRPTVATGDNTRRST